ncbi:hypothetical protein JCM8547_005691 [Rhodosporidiobolus lusitaniae]
MPKFPRGADSLLVEAMERVPCTTDERKRLGWHLPDGEPGSYADHLAISINHLNREQQGFVPEITPVDVSERLKKVDKRLGEAGHQTGNAEATRQARLNLLRNDIQAAQAPRERRPRHGPAVNAQVGNPQDPVVGGNHLYAHGLAPPALLESQAYPDGPAGAYSECGDHEEYPEGIAQGAPLTLQPRYDGPPGPPNPYNHYYRSLGHGQPSYRFSPDAGAFPIRHAVIYGHRVDGRMF